MRVVQQASPSPPPLGRSLVSAIVSRATGRISCGPLYADFAEGQLLSINEHPVDFLYTTLDTAPPPTLQVPTSRAESLLYVLEAFEQAHPVPEAARVTLAQSTLQLQRHPNVDDETLRDWLRIPAHHSMRLVDLPAPRAAIAIWLGVAYVATHPADPPRYLPLRTPAAEPRIQWSARLQNELDAPQASAAILRDHLESTESPEAHWWSWLGDMHFRGDDGPGAVSAYRIACKLDGPSSLLLVSWARASLLDPAKGDLETWFAHCEALWTQDPSLRSLAFWLARWHRRAALARRAVLQEPHQDLNLWAEASQLWPDDAMVSEGYASALANHGSPAAAALVLAEVTSRLEDPTDRSRVALLSAEHAAAARWNDWEVAMYDYVTGQTPELEFSHAITDPSIELDEALPTGARSESRDSIEMIAYQLGTEAPDPEALEALDAYAQDDLGDAERVADALERAARRSTDSKLRTRLYRSLAELTLDRLEQPQRALWALEHAGHQAGESLTRQAMLEARATDAMQGRPGSERQLAALWRRSPNDYERAIVYYQTAIKADPNDAVAYRSLERLFRILGNDQQADSMLDRQVHVAASDVERRALRRRVQARRALAKASEFATQRREATAPTLLPPGQDALHYGVVRARQRPAPREATVALDSLLSYRESPSAKSATEFARHFGGSTSLFRSALQHAYENQNEAQSQSVIAMWCERHPHDISAYRQQLREALDRSDSEGTIRAADELLTRPLLHESHAELQESWQQSSDIRKRLQERLVDRLGSRFPLALDGCARKEWSLFNTDATSRESILVELYHRYTADDDLEHAAWALARLCAFEFNTL